MHSITLSSAAEIRHTQKGTYWEVYMLEGCLVVSLLASLDSEVWIQALGGSVWHGFTVVSINVELSNTCVIKGAGMLLPG